ncbi:ATP-binding protein [Bizionia arctica]|uniref:histidine kinase n=1 Tax=Bizionia arctica TaxID=1495645 RepID=A0A917GVN3_9FLAO|nr:ATP-binding protein [Bizionia arctica]GGG58297.1 hypothetical protein GCM10010976_31420 [Bizionia arctica]
MDFKRVYTTSKAYIILLIVALVLLVATASMAYMQILHMQKSSELVKHTLRVYNNLNILTTHYSKAESEEFRGELLKTGGSGQVFKDYRQEGLDIIDNLKNLTADNAIQVERLQSLSILLDRLYSQLQQLDAVNYKNSQEAISYKQSQKMKINGTLFHIRGLTNQMLSAEQNLIQEREKAYDSEKALAPLTLLMLTFISVLVFVLSFIRIYKNKIRFRESEAFLKNVLSTTDNIVNYYEPIFDKNNNVVDFKIIYANDCNRDYFGLEPIDIVGKQVSHVFPFLLNNGELEKMKKSYNEETKEISDRHIIVQDEKMWFQSLVTPLGNGILETARNTTSEEKAKEIQLTFNKRLEKQNLQLLDSRAFLGNIFKSISHVIMHFKSIRNEKGVITDFEILFVNERINPVTGDIPEDLKNKLVSQVFPNVFENHVFENLVNAIELNKPQEYEAPYERNGITTWFSATAIKLDDGVTVTTRDITEEKLKANELIKLNEQLVIRNSILNDAENIAKIGSFLWYKDSDKFEISENLLHMLEMETSVFEISYETYKSFIHPDDLVLVEEKSNQSNNNAIPTEYTYRVITKKGNVKHFKTNGQLLNKGEEDIMIGVVQDVTKTIEAGVELRKSNLELRRSNAELESFNRVASHDLQEPLRKIQLFISRIEDKESENFSSKGIEYFQKVKNAGIRMQSLIQNLLAYSRIDSSRTDFETIDLNLVQEKVLEDLATNIQVANAIIKLDDLPGIKGVFFQMEQLFANLISNALKYKSTIDTPIIEITSKKIAAIDLPENVIRTNKYYYKITFTDNGIGFDEKYADKIFEVFQRLHQKTEYSGTGIGLAICKKIVENHNGFMYAKGKLGEGAQFIVYLPA